MPANADRADGVGAGRPSRRRTLWGDPDALASALRATLADERFVASPRTSELLVHLVERTIAGDADPLRSARLTIAPTASSGDADPLLDVLLTRLQRLLAARRARVGEHEAVLRLAPRAYVVVERAELGDDAFVGTDGSTGAHAS